LTILIFILLLVVSYLIGAIPTAYLVVKWRYKKDIRQYGSGSVGASNVYRNFSKRMGIAVFIWDIAKGVLVVWIAQLPDGPLYYQSAAALMVVIGHNWPVFLRFNAGRGVATTLGAAAMLMPWVIIIFVSLEIISILVRNSPTFVLIGFALMPVAGLILNQPEAITLGLLGLFLLTVIRRLTAPRSERSKSVKTGELLLNRLLFDRDIRDGKAWISFQEAESKKTSSRDENT
jgi:acyl phosphate:glycerol-3-phosphate acyltransferase